VDTIVAPRVLGDEPGPLQPVGDALQAVVERYWKYASMLLASRLRLMQWLAVRKYGPGEPELATKPPLQM
jgi:hypothetical protein